MLTKSRSIYTGNPDCNGTCTGGGGLIKNDSDQLVHRGYTAHGSVALGPVYIYHPT